MTKIHKTWITVSLKFQQFLSACVFMKLSARFRYCFFLEFIHCENKLESSLSTEKTFVNIFRLTSSYTVKEMVNNCQNAVLTEPADQKILRTCCRGQGQASKWGHLVYEASLDYRISSDPKSVWHQSISENSEILLIQIGTFISILSSLLCR